MNILTEATNKVVEIGVTAGQKFKGMEPYGMVKATKAEQKQQLGKLTPDVLAKLTRQYGAKAVDKKLRGLL